MSHRSRAVAGSNWITPSIDMGEVPTPRNRARVGVIRRPGTEKIWENHYQAPDPGQISIPNPGLRTRPALRYIQIHGNNEAPLWDWESPLSGQMVGFTNHFGPYEERKQGPNTGPGRVSIGRRQPVTELKESS